MTYIIILIISAVAQYFLPWWVIAPISFIFCAWKSESAKGAYAAAAGAIASVWTAYTIYLNSTTDSIMANKIAALFTFGSSFLEKLPTAGYLGFVAILLASTVAGLSGVAGYNFRQLFK
ncbi:MAG: hypothetical protein MUF45_09595 [Spirosomaceae bacterium]|jgi:hypothetical protein|nr:hypothetical protein [Spirosomataceae bacterium]